MSARRHPARRALSARFLGRARAITRAAAESLEPRRLFAAGVLDPAFAGTGMRTTDYRSADDAVDGAFAFDQTAVVVGTTNSGGAVGRDAFISNYNPDGSVNTNFGAGGVTFLDLGSNEIATAVKVQQTDGKFVVAGITGNTSALQGDFFVARFNTNGSLDTTFANNGMRVIDFGGLDAAADLVITPTGHIVIVGASVSINPFNPGGGIALAFLNPDGSVDTTKGGGTGRTVTTAPAGRIEGGTAIVQSGTDFFVAGFQATASLTGSVAADFMVARFDANGALSPVFDTDGRAFFDFGRSTELAVGIALDPRNGNVVASGVTADGLLDDIAPGLPLPPGSGRANVADFALARFTATGAVDTTFGGGGATTGVTGNRDGSSDVFVMPDGRVVAVGGTQYPNDSVDFLVVRRMPDGSPDTAFGSLQGAVTTNFGTPSDDGAFFVVEDPNGLIFAGGHAVGSAGGDVALARYQNEAGPVTAGPLTISVNDINVTEGNAGSIPANFTVSLNRTSTSDVTVDFTTAVGTADLSDYNLTANTVTIPAGQLSATVTVLVLGDLAVEPDETFTLNLSNPTGGATIADAQGTATILNEDGTGPLPTISIADLSQAEGIQGTGQFVFTLTLSAPSVVPVSVTAITVDVSAARGIDFIPKEETFTFAPGETTKTFSVGVFGDTTIEDDETFTVQLFNAIGATLPDDDATGTIVNDDSNNAVTIAPVATTGIPSPFVPGLSKGSVNVTLANTSTTRQRGRFVVNLFGSPTPALNTSTAVPLGRVTTKTITLNPGRTSRVKVNLNPARSTPSGSYFVIATVTGPGVTSPSAAFSTSAAPINISQPLITLNPGPTPPPNITVASGRRGNLVFTLVNNGNTRARGRINIDRILTLDATLATTRYTFFTKAVNINIPAGRSARVSMPFTAPKAAPSSPSDLNFLAPGTYTALVIIKSSSLGGVTNTSDGQTVATLQFTIT